MSVPAREIEPESMRNDPATALSKVDLPEPFVPIMTTNDPSVTVRLHDAAQSPGFPSEFLSGLHRAVRKSAVLCRVLGFFVVCMGGFLCAGRVGIFGHWKEDWTVVTEFTEVAPDNLEKEEYTRSIEQCQRLTPRTVKFKIAAVRTAFPPNSTHADKSLAQSPISPLPPSILLRIPNKSRAGL